MVENAWDGKYMQKLPGAIGKGLHYKVFVTQKFTQCKTSRTLKINVFKIPDNKKIGKLFSKYELLFFY